MGKTVLKFNAQLAQDLRSLMAVEGVEYGSAYCDVQVLVEALADYGHELEGHEHDCVSKPLLASRPWAVYTLRRTPPNEVAIGATGEPVLRVPYVWLKDEQGSKYAFVVMVADKSAIDDERQWYIDLAADVALIVNEWREANPGHVVLTYRSIEKGRN